MSLITTALNNPDFAVLFSAGAGYLGRLLWKKAKSLTESELWDTMLKVAYQAFPKLFQDPKLYDDEHVRKVITDTIWAGLARLEVQKNATTLKLVADVVEHAVGELALMVTQHHFGTFIEKQKQTVDILKTATETPVAPAT